MSAPPPIQIQRRHFAELGVGMIVGGLTSFVAIPGCDARPTGTDAVRRYRVSGCSMNPTLRGPSRAVSCEICGVTIRVEDDVLAEAIANLAAKTLPPTSVQCWHCGGPVASKQLIAAMQNSPLPPDLVDVVTCPPADLQIGDIVLVQSNGLHVKRLIGKPGQTVSRDELGRLLIDGERPTFSPMPRVPVDDDRLRESSRWHDLATSTHWQRDSNRAWTASGDAGWLVYEHENVYRGNRPSRILDDYPGNLGVQRSLYPVDGFSIEFELAAPNDHRETAVDVWIGFWNERGIDVQHQTVQLNGETSVHVKSQAGLRAASQANDEIEPAAMTNDLLSPKRPIGLRIVPANNDSVTVRDLSVSRDVLYRIDPTSRRSESPGEYAPPEFPLRLSDDEWFVVGDNVPLSIDSRHWGAVDTVQIVGRAARLE